MGRIVQLAENAPQSLKNALENKELSINRGWRILKAVQQLPPEERESAAAEMLSAVRKIDQSDAEVNRRGRIAGLFCKAYEKSGPADSYGRKCADLDGVYPHDAGRN